MYMYMYMYMYWRQVLESLQLLRQHAVLNELYASCFRPLPDGG